MHEVSARRYTVWNIHWVHWSVVTSHFIKSDTKYHFYCYVSTVTPLMDDGRMASGEQIHAG